MRNERIGFIGAGQMAEAIARGVLAAELFPPAALAASDVSEPRRRLFSELGIRAAERNLEIVPECDVLLVAVKPQNLDEVLRQVGPSLRKEQLLITHLRRLRDDALRSRRERAGPRRPRHAEPARAGPHGRHRALLRALRDAGRPRTRPRDFQRGRPRRRRRASDLMDAVTALSGSGPAYFDFLIEAMVEAGRREGIPEPIARALVVQTAHGAAEMIIADDLPPGELRRRVTSKAGTTEAAVRRLEELDAREAILQAIHAAAERAKELGKR